MPRWAQAHPDDFAVIRAEIEKRHDEAVKRLQTWIRQPSIAAENRGMTEGGDLMIRSTNDVSTVAVAVREALPAMLISGVRALVLLAAVFLLNPRSTPCATRCRATDSSYVGSPSLRRGARSGQLGCRPA